MADLIELSPGSAEWKAWLAHYRQTRNHKAEMSMLASAKRGAGFLVRTRKPPVEPVSRGLSGVRPLPPKPELVIERGARRSVDEVADRLVARQQKAAVETEAQRKVRKAVRSERDKVEAAFERVQAGHGVDVDDLPSAFGVVEAIDPGEAAEVMDGKRKAAAPRVKITALRDDPIGQMERRGQLCAVFADGGREDEEAGMLRLKAARSMQALYEAAELGGARGIDPFKVKVDGGRMAELDTDARYAAVTRIAQLEGAMALPDVDLLRYVLWHKMTLGQVDALATGLARSRKRAVRDLGARLRAALDVLANRMGLIAEGKGPRRGRDRFDQDARLVAAGGPQLHRAAGLAGRSI